MALILAQRSDLSHGHMHWSITHAVPIDIGLSDRAHVCDPFIENELTREARKEGPSGELPLCSIPNIQRFSQTLYLHVHGSHVKI